MKTLSTTILLIALVILTSFTSKKESKTTTIYYVFVISTEWDKHYDEPGNNGYVDLTTDIVSFNCSRSDTNIKHQFSEHYNAQEFNDHCSLAFDNSTSTAWIYTSYDDAVVSKREENGLQNKMPKTKESSAIFI